MFTIAIVLESFISLIKVLEERDRLPHCPPVLAKIAPDLSDEEMDDIAAVALRPVRTKFFN